MSTIDNDDLDLLLRQGLKQVLDTPVPQPSLQPIRQARAPQTQTRSRGFWMAFGIRPGQMTAVLYLQFTRFARCGAPY